ncbi:MAG: hypothetical protein OIN87_03815 [Candidatus Methanoperedens sp.]|nr:hypothetical protein [Candidatus Methanoperedens sp.]
MGFSTSAVVAIFTVSLIYMASMFYPVVEMSYNKIQEAEKESDELSNEKLNTKITIKDWTSTTLEVFNDGSVTLDSRKINVIVNGTWTSSLKVVPSGVWAPKTSIVVEEINISNSKIKVITANGAAVYITT